VFKTVWLGNGFQYRLDAVFGAYFVLFGLNFVKITKNLKKLLLFKAKRFPQV